MAEEKKNETAIHEGDDKHHTATQDHPHEVSIAVTDARGNTENIGSEQIVQLVVIRDGLPSAIFTNKQRLTSLSAGSANDYRGATLAFTYQGRNYLATVKDVTPAAGGQGKLTIITATGEELHIRRGKQGKPELVPVNARSIEFDTGGEIRGVLFMP